MIFPKKKTSRNLIISFSILVAFALLMLFGLRHNPNFTPSPLVGKTSPSFTASLSSGKPFSFPTKESQGKWVVMNFWSTSCAVCREETHELQNFYQVVAFTKNKTIEFVSVNIQDSSQAIFQWQKDFSQTFPVVQDSQGLVSVNYGVTGTPETFFIDPNNTIRYRIAGAVNKQIILNFIDWLRNNPYATESEAGENLMRLSSGN
jgi:cytochrome c biogenesis protein CcmG/thiol:disulfide interchange protein DsbE